jgi:POT family proton-dependent oligopeptide transporter
MTALMMGGWFLSTSLGNKLSGVLATLWDTFENKQHFFLMNFSLLALAALTLFLLLRWLNGIFREYSGD